MQSSFLSWANALSTTLRSSPERVATSLADTGLPALRIVSRTFAVVSITTCIQRWTACGKPFRVSRVRGLPCEHGRWLIIELYNLDVIISVGYRVKSHRGVQFRRWANSVLKDTTQKGMRLPALTMCLLAIIV